MTTMTPAALPADMDAQKLRRALSKYALPSASELRHLQAADPTNSYRASFFRLQIDELLGAVQSQPSSSKSAAGLQAVLFEIKHILEAMGAQQVTQEALQATALPVRNHVKRKEIVLPFQKPARLDVVGSFILKNMVFARKSRHAEYGTFTVDLAVEIPAACFLPKDFANYRYFDKRNLYLGMLLAELQGHTKLFSEVALTAFRGDYDKPIGVLHVNARHLADHHIKLANMCIRVIPVITPEVFKLAKLAPSRNNIRHDPNMTEDEMRQCSSPQYNNAVLEDMMVKQHTRELHEVLSDSPQFVEATVLAKVWLRQRGFHRALDSVNGFLLSMLLLYLYRTKRIAAQTPSEQMLKVLLQFIANHDADKQALQFPPMEGGVTVTTEGMHAFQSAFDVVFLDSSGRLNLFGRVSCSAWQELRFAAQEAMHMVQRGSMDDFSALFIKKNDFWTRYDQYFWFPAPAQVNDADEDTYTVDEKRAINDMGLERFWVRKLTSLLTRALTDRVRLVRAFTCASEEWSMRQEGFPLRRKVAIGLRIDPEHVWRIVDKGPTADDKPACAVFRRFWKEKSELRRFKDGAIVEAVVWDEIPPDHKHVLLETIVRFIVPAHCPQVISSEHIRTSNASLYSALDVEEHITSAITKKMAGTSFESSMNSVSKLWVIFNAFAKKLRELESLPLKVVDVMPLHAAFRYTGLMPVQPHPLAYSKSEKVLSTPMAHVGTVLEPLVLHMTFERSAAWPNEWRALQHAKTGFYVHIAHELETRHHLRCEVAVNGVDVFHHGYAFRLVVKTEKELTAVTGATAATKMSVLHTVEYITTKQQSEYAVRHANIIHALHTKNTSYGPTVRLAQRWLADKFMTNALRVEAVELLVAYGFVQTTATSAPHSILSGFTRFLKLLATYDWTESPLIVDLNATLNDDMQRELLHRFEASKSSPSSHAAMFIAADYEDIDCLSTWTRFAPDTVTVQRLVALAKVSYDALTHWLASGTSSSGWKSVFAASKSDFDAALCLSVDKLPTKKMKIEAGKKGKRPAFTAHVYKNMDLTSVPVMVGFDPVQDLLRDLETRFGHLALFFLNGLDSREILLTWKPQAFLPTKFRAIASSTLLALPKTAAPGGEDDTEEADGRTYAVPNVLEILSEMQRLGTGMIDRIALQPFPADIE